MFNYNSSKLKKPLAIPPEKDKRELEAALGAERRARNHDKRTILRMKDKIEYLEKENLALRQALEKK